MNRGGEGEVLCDNATSPLSLMPAHAINDQYKKKPPYKYHTAGL